MAYLGSCSCGVTLNIPETRDEILLYWDDVQKLIAHHRTNPDCVFSEVAAA